MRWRWRRDWQQLFGDRYYLELQRLGRADDEALVAKTVALQPEDRPSPWWPPTTCASSRPADFESHEARVHRARARSSPILRGRAGTPRRSTCVRPRKWPKLFADIPEALQNTRGNRAALLAAVEARRVAAADLSDCPRACRSRVYIREESLKGFEAREKALDPEAARTSRRLSRSGSTRELACHHQDGLRGLLPHRGRFHPVGTREWRAGGAGPRFGRGLAGGLQPRHHRHRSARSTTCCSSAS